MAELARLARRRADRDAAGVVVLEGPKLLAVALDVGATVLEVYVAAGDLTPAEQRLVDQAETRGAVVRSLAPEALQRVADTATPQGVLALVERPTPHPAALDRADLVLVLVDVADPGNAGTLIRTAEAAGAGAVVLAGRGVDPWSPKVARASAGAVLLVPLIVEADPAGLLDRLGERGVRRLATRAGAGRTYDAVDLTGPVAVVLGSEAHGLPPGLDAHVDSPVAIPMVGRSESLNVTAAGAVLCFEVQRQRRAAAAGGSDLAGDVEAGQGSTP